MAICKWVFKVIFLGFYHRCKCAFQYKLRENFGVLRLGPFSANTLQQEID